MDDELAELILDDFNNAVGVHDTIWYGFATTLYDKIISTIDKYDKDKKGELFEFHTENVVQ